LVKRPLREGREGGREGGRERRKVRYQFSEKTLREGGRKRGKGRRVSIDDMFGGTRIKVLVPDFG